MGTWCWPASWPTADDLKAAYAPWLALEVSEQDEGWIRMTAQRKS